MCGIEETVNTGIFLNEKCPFITNNCHYSHYISESLLSINKLGDIVMIYTPVGKKNHNCEVQLKGRVNFIVGSIFTQ